MMEEPERRSMLYFIEGNRTSEICRLVYCVKIKESSDTVLKAFSSAAKEYSSEAVTGLLLVYPQYMVEVVSRFFDKWYARKASQYNFPLNKMSTDKILEDNFDNASAIYQKTILNLYQFYEEVRRLNNRNHTLMVELLESLNEDGHRLLAETSTMEFILNSCWGQSLEELTDRFLNPISIDPNTAWPFPKVTLPRVDFRNIDNMKAQLRMNNVETSVSKE